ncbi:MAG: hypothetical protein GY827_12830 [Cytophagales bacterium]|nr:hypothetical protein [Cytophagales bacterium]
MMGNDLEIHEQITRYLQNQLHGEELTNFQNELVNNPSLAEEVEMQQMVQAVTIDSHLASVREKMETYRPQKAKPTIPPIRNIVAITLVALLGLGGTFYATNNYFSNTQEPTTIASITPSTIEDNEQIMASSNVEPIENTTTELDNSINNSIETINKTKVTTPNKSEKTDKNNDGEFLDLSSNSKKTILGEKQSTKIGNNETNTEENIHSTSSVAPAEKNPCNQELFKVKIHTIPTCDGMQTGRIQITEITGGTAPYLTKMSQTQEYQEGHKFDNLQAGIHTLYIQDNKGCVYEKQLNIEAKACIKIYPYDPSLGKAWKHTTETDKVSIFDNQGTKVFEGSAQDGSFEWDGKNNEGETLKGGRYLFVPENGEKAYIQIIK